MAETRKMDKLKRDLLESFVAALKALDPTARVLVLEVFPGWNPEGRPESDDVKLSETQMDRINALIGPNYKVGPTETDHG